jgi:hypothetical protein
VSAPLVAEDEGVGGDVRVAAAETVERASAWSTIGTDRTLPDFGTRSWPPVKLRRTKTDRLAKSTSRQRSARSSPMRSPV